MDHARGAVGLDCVQAAKLAYEQDELEVRGDARHLKGEKLR